MRSRLGTFALAAALLLVLMASGALAGCSKGKKGCRQCANSRRCKTCANGWSLASNGACVRCSHSCKRCNWRSPKKCTACYDGSYLKNGACKLCPSKCSKCILFKGKPFCTKCRKGFKLNGSGKCVVVTPPAKCPPMEPVWDSDAYEWKGVFGKKNDGSCVPCTPGGNHAGWCKACDGDAPSICTKCEDYNNGFPMYVSQFGNCEFCTALHGGCLACKDGSGHCTQCDEANNWFPDGQGGCTNQP